MREEVAKLVSSREGLVHHAAVEAALVRHDTPPVTTNYAKKLADFEDHLKALQSEASDLHLYLQIVQMRTYRAVQAEIDKIVPDLELQLNDFPDIAAVIAYDRGWREYEAPVKGGPLYRVEKPRPDEDESRRARYDAIAGEIRSLRSQQGTIAGTLSLMISQTPELAVAF